MDSNARSIAKAVSYRVLGSAATALVVFIVSGRLGVGASDRIGVALSSGALDGVIKIALYFVHERVWNHIDYGRPKPPEYEI
jgi:adenylylsulfate kinase